MTKASLQRLLDAAKKVEESVWDFADAVAEAKDQTGMSFRELEGYLVANGYKRFSASYLNQLYSTAKAFDNRSRASESFSTHRLARSPERLEAMRQAWEEKGCPGLRPENGVTTKFAQNYVSESSYVPPPKPYEEYDPWGAALGLHKTIKQLRDGLDKVTPEIADAVFETIEEVLPSLRELSSEYKKRGTKRGHLNVVPKGGAA
jgi:hypothetical protein